MMLRRVFKCLVALLCVFLEINASSDNETLTGDFLPVCKRSDPDLNDCVKNVTYLLRDKLINGIPDLKLPPLEPLKVPSIKLEQHTKELSYKAVLMDVMIYGLSQYEFSDVDIDLAKMKFEAEAKFKHVYLDAEYMLMGKFQMLPVEGSGRLMVNFTDSTMDIKIKGGLVKRHDDFYFMAHDTAVSVDVGNSQANFENLYSGNEDKSKISEHLINMHSDEILKELRPAVETVVSMLLDDVTTKFYRNIPFNKLFPE